MAKCNLLKINIKSNSDEDFNLTVEMEFVNPRKVITPIGVFDFGGPKGKVSQWVRYCGRLLNRI